MRMPETIEYAPKGRVWPWSRMVTLTGVRTSGLVQRDGAVVINFTAEASVTSRVGFRRWLKRVRS